MLIVLKTICEEWWIRYTNTSISKGTVKKKSKQIE